VHEIKYNKVILPLLINIPPKLVHAKLSAKRFCRHFERLGPLFTGLNNGYDFCQLFMELIIPQK